MYRLKDTVQLKVPSVLNSEQSNRTIVRLSCFRPIVPERNFRKPFHIPLELSTVGFGSYLGAPDDPTDFDVYNALKLLVLSGGVNVIDTAINYRCSKAERVIGACLKTLTRKYGIKRDELFVCTKNGYIPDDADKGAPA
jgi:aryl-alcohol dehydrogenase-like predicted oxidoreductase